MKFLIAGLGSIGRRHLRNLLALGQRDIVLYRTGRSTLPDDELAGFPVETDLATALARHRPDAVIVANPTALHLDVAIPAARAGAHLLLEKPVAHDWRRVPELRQAVAASGVRVLVGFQFRFHPTLRAVQSWLAEGRLGQVLYARAHWGEYLPAWHPWEDYRHSYAAREDLGGGVIRTLCHPLDYLRALLAAADPDDPRVLQAWAGHISPLELQGVEDTADIVLAFASGAIATVHVNYIQRPPRHDLEIVGTQGTARWDYASGRAVLLGPDGTVQAQADLPPGWERNDMFLAEMRHFLALVRGEATSQCTLDDGLAALRLVLEARAAAGWGTAS